MTLKPPKPQLPVSESANQLQREAASRVTQRYEEQCQKEKRREIRARIRSWLSILFLLGLCGGGYYVWRSGSLKDWKQWADSITDRFLGAGDRAEDPLTALERKFREAKVDYWQNAPAKDRPLESIVVAPRFFVNTMGRKCGLFRRPDLRKHKNS